ncbi:recombinase family protein [Mycobacterium sp. SM1]|uniref:recombinase family protein n=1 Tax=Mycobacterium sp. SM1 TaxID=2816243 RepID=UPI0027DBC828|nr:recombinase family protein [Mycobacterium sp. SM1]
MFTDTAASKVSAAQLAKPALLYVRQSTLKQVIHNAESAHRQYDLRSRAIALGWADDQISVIDIDQGHSGASSADREGFQHLVAEVSLGRAGIVLGLECSRLARNSADWHQLLELCAMTGTLICDEDGLYDPRQFNDRLLLGMKGQMSEAELHFIKARLRGGVLSKARRGELVMPLPVGLVHDAVGHVVLDPDTAVQHALRHLFDTFAATGSASACVKAFREADLLFPWRHLKGPRKDELDWKPLGHHTVLRVLHNPRYAGAFTYGRYRHHKLPSGKWSSTLLPREEWISFIPDAHPGYITLDQYDANRARLAANAAAHGRDRAGGPPREGPALLQGIIICGRCGKRMTVRYNHRRGQPLPTYVCQRDGIENAKRICANIFGADLDRRIGQLLCDTLTPLAVEAALTVSAELEQRSADADRIRAAHVERARYRADLARRRYLAVDPANRLVADSLEADWNTALRELGDTQQAYDKARQQHPGQLTDAQRARIGQLVTDLPAIWNDPHTPTRERKRIARLLLTDVTIHRDSDTITAHVRFSGGTDTTLTLPAPKPVGEQRKTPANIVAVVDELLDEHISGEVAEILNQRGLTTGTGQPFHHKIVDNIIHTYRLRSRRQRLRAAGMLTPTETATLLGISRHTLKAWHRTGIVSGLRYNDKGETLYHPPDPDNPPQRPKIGRRPKRAGQPEQETPHASTQ